MDKQSCEIFDDKSVPDALATLQGCVDALDADSKWLIGAGFDLTIFVDEPPSRAMLDKLVGNRPLAMFVWSADGHSCWINSEFVRRAKLPDSTPGNLHETECAPLAALLPQPTLEQRKQAILVAQQIANDAGITSIIEANSDQPMLDAYLALEAEGKLSMHVSLSIGWEAFIGGADDVDARATQIASLRTKQRDTQAANGIDESTALVQIKFVKLFIDGVLEAATASLLEPVENSISFFFFFLSLICWIFCCLHNCCKYVNSTSKGSPRYTQEKLDSIAVALYNHNLSIHAHAIGDGAGKL